MKAAGTGRIDRIRHISGKDDPLAAGIRIRDWNCGEQSLGVGMQGILEQLFGVAQLDDLSQVHHGDPLAGVLHDQEMVGDEQVGQIEIGLKLFQ